MCAPVRIGWRQGDNLSGAGKTPEGNRGDGRPVCPGWGRGVSTLKEGNGGGGGGDGGRAIAGSSGGGGGSGGDRGRRGEY